MDNCEICEKYRQHLAVIKHDTAELETVVEQYRAAWNLLYLKLTGCSPFEYGSIEEEKNRMVQQIELLQSIADLTNHPE
jgi:hypothetical protein